MKQKRSACFWWLLLGLALAAAPDAAAARERRRAAPPPDKAAESEAARQPEAARGDRPELLFAGLGESRQAAMAAYLLGLWDVLEREFPEGGRPAPNITVEINGFGTEVEFRKKLLADGKNPNLVGAYYRRLSPGHGELVVPLYRQDMSGAMAHELTHAFFGLKYPGRLPVFVNEGLAEYYAAEYAHSAETPRVLPKDWKTEDQWLAMTAEEWGSENRISYRGAQYYYAWKYVERRMSDPRRKKGFMDYLSARLFP